MPRSLRKGPFIDEGLMRKVLAKSSSGSLSGAIKTYSRRSDILPMMDGMTFEVHNGKEFVKVFIVPEMIGKKLGAFAPTRKAPRHKEKDDGRK